MRNASQKIKTVVAISGSGNTGKTSTIKNIFRKLIAQRNTTSSSVIFGDDLIGGPDLKATLAKSTGHLIGIESQGDPGSRLQSSLNDFERLHCDIIVCATRSRGDTVDMVSALSSRGYRIIWTSNYVSYEISETVLNNQFADHIVTLIDNIITGAI